ncbi:MAG: hypothetical protein KGI58_00675 [Patescibacteria group bacterium]|nr:hypothetical protein [Patescibacteria group bacterium]
MYVVKRSVHNPILIPNRDHYWEAFATFNMCPIKIGKVTYGLYRAISAVDQMAIQKQISTIGIGKSRDGIHFEDREPFIVPVEEWEAHGCEDPRITYFEGKYYIFYTALSRYPFGPEGIKVAVAVSNDLKKVNERHFVTPFNAKAMTLFPKRINGKITVIFSAHTDSPPAKMSIAQVDHMEQLWDIDFWEEWIKNIDEHTISFRRTQYDHLEVGAPPILTKYGWLLVYSHIQNYFPSPEKLDRIFGIEALLLDKNDLTKVIGRTKGPILAPNEPYELSGYVNDVVFPTGALVNKDILTIYYGAADTTTCTAHVNLNDLIFSMCPDKFPDFQFKRSAKNPIISPKSENDWESKATFNPAAIYLGGKTHILYRTLSGDNTSYIGYASSKDGINLIERLNSPIYVPREDFEKKKISGGNSGCEDPRITQIGKNLYICYTAYDSIGPPHVAISSITVKDFLAHKWNWTKPALVTPPAFDDKDTCLFPEKLKNGYFILHRVGNDICGDYLKSLDFEKNMVHKCIRVLAPRLNSWDSAKVGITAPPIKTKYGWLLLYHGVSKSHGTYRVGAVLLDLKDPGIILSQSTDPIFEPIESYEKVGIVNNVVFPCGMVRKGDLLYIYYGGGDKVVGVATMKFSTILSALVHGKRFNDK